MTTTVDAFLGGRLQIEQPAIGYRAGIDPVLLAASCRAKEGDTVLDLGCGVGTAALCLAARLPVSVYGVELHPDQAELAERNAARNGIHLRVSVGDAMQRPTVLQDMSFDQVITNPPYFDPNTGPTSAVGTRAMGRSGAIDLSLWVGTAFKRLRPKGWLTVVQRMERLPDVLAAMAQFGDVQVLPIAARHGRAPHLVLVRGRKSAKAPFHMCSPLVMHVGASHDGDRESYVSSVQAVLRDGATLDWGR